jgi:hypothetical protein
MAESIPRNDGKVVIPEHLHGHIHLVEAENQNSFPLALNVHVFHVDAVAENKL